MRRIDEAEEQAELLRSKKKKIIAAAVLGVVCVSLYGWWRKTLPVPDTAMLHRNEVAESAHKKQEEVIVYVSGLVKNPGLIKLSSSSRVLDGINAAGGLLPGADISKVNLAKELRDGMQINVPGQLLIQRELSPNYSENTPGNQNQIKAPTTRSINPENKININTADTSELDKLPGVGPAMAAKIVEWRNTNGSFQTGDDLKNIKGIGEAKYEKLKDKISW